MTHPSGEPSDTTPDPWRWAFNFGVWALVNGMLFFLVPFLMMRSYAFDAYITDTRSGQEIALSREEYYREAQNAMLCALVLMNLAGLAMWFLSPSRKLWRR